MLDKTFVVDLNKNPKVIHTLFRLTDGQTDQQEGLTDRETERQTDERRRRKRRGTGHSLPAIPAEIMCTCVESGSRTPFSFSLAVE